MPLKFFICPDGETRTIEQCLKTCPRQVEGRCMALAHLIHIGTGQRTWEGTASVTQLIKGTRQAYLEIVKDYAVDPDSRGFALYGTLHHRRLEFINKKLDGLSEEKITGDITGTLDRLEPDELKLGYYKLIDYKLVGAYSVAKALGILKENGDPDMREWELQLNKYRILLEQSELAKEFPISRLLIQATIRDSGLRQMKSYNLPRRMPLIPVKKIDDDIVNEFFITKEYALMTALEKNEMPEICGYEERWGNRKCKGGYCDVIPFCPEGSQMNRISLIT